MRIVLYAHAGHETGSGHVVRCLALAEEAARRGHEPFLVGHLETKELLQDPVLDVVQLDSRDPYAASAVISRLRPDLVHTDVYEAAPSGGAWATSTVRDGPFGQQVADLVIDPTPGAEEDGPADVHGRHLLGTDYAPMRQAVSSRHAVWQFNGYGRVLVTMGSTDPMGLTPAVVELLVHSGVGPDVAVLGSSPAPELAGFGIRLVPLTPRFADLALDYDLVVSAAGTTALELACLGVPTALVCAVPNQRPTYDFMVRQELCLGLGSPPRWDLGTQEALQRVWGDASGLASMSNRAASRVDGLGASRVVDAWERMFASTPPLREGEWTLRRATESDADTLLGWRNDPVTRRQSRQSSPVRRIDHLTWLSASLANENRLLLMAEVDGRKVGSVRWDACARGAWEVSITVAPEARGRGLARCLLTLAEAALVEARPEAAVAVAVVREQNRASSQLFRGSGYAIESGPDADGWLTFSKLLASG